MTNADRIRAMTDEELAHFWETRPVSCPPMETLCSGKNCYDCWLDWLKQEVSDNGWADILIRGMEMPKMLGWKEVSEK